MLSISKPFVVGYVLPELLMMSHLLTSTKNPTISAACDNLTIGQAYCVEALSEPAPAPSPNPGLFLTIQAGRGAYQFNTYQHEAFGNHFDQRWEWYFDAIAHSAGYGHELR
jgi:hypothetical protein